MRLATKAIVFLLLMLVPLMTLTGWVSIQREQQVLNQLLVENGNSTARMIAVFCIESLLAEDYPLLDTFLSTTGKESKDIYLLEVISNKRVVSQFKRQWKEGEVLVNFSSNITLTDDNLEQIRLGEVRLALSDRRNRELISERIREMILFTLLVFLLAFGGVIFLLRKIILEKVQRLDEHARRIGRGDLKSRLSFYSGDELAELADTLNEMSRNILESQDEIAGQNLELQEKAKALEKSTKEALAANRAKSEFLANMSHEFRTPLNSVIGLTQMLTQRQGVDPEAREEVDRIHTAGQMLLNLVNDILDLSKIEAGEINLEMIPIELDSVLRELGAMLLPQAQEKGLELIILPLPTAAGGYIISDPTRLRQMLLNLLNNAIKFTSRGSVSLSVEVVGQVHISEDGVRHQQLRFLVKDTGWGIPTDIQATLFDAFRQADSSITRKHGGTGLGLAIVKQLCEEMGGNVSLESVIGEGSCFSIELPFRIAMEEEVKEAGLYRKQLRILLAEDDSEHRESLIAMCHQLGWSAEAVEDGRKLLQRYEEIHQ